MGEPIRAATADDFPELARIERSGEAMFAAMGIVFPAGPMVIETIGTEARFVIVAGEPIVGFAAVIDVDGRPHLEQISVDAEHVGRGIGRSLVREVIHRTSGDVTLITFRDVPWNGPWYRRQGFRELPGAEWGRELRAHWQAEIDGGLHELGPRIVMVSTQTS